MNYKIVFFDVDGTITNHHDGSISHATKVAISKLLEKGIKVVAATGRPLSMCKEIGSLGIDTFITANGAYVKHRQQVIHKVAMQKTYVKELVEYAILQNDGLSFFTEEFSMNGARNQAIQRALRETLSLRDYPVTNQQIINEEVYLMCLYGNEDTEKRYSDRFPTLSFQRWHPFVLNILQEEVSKSLAIKQVLNYFQIDKSEAIAFGDGENDIDMLELVGLGVAMGNGHAKVKKVANFVTKKSSEDGIEYALKKYSLI